MEVFPNYYNKFKCIADRCNHSCCIGWEIDIDEDTMQLYNSIEGEMGDRIRNSIDESGPSFILRDDERCPFLKDNGLCEIICKYGDDAISDICYLHPRFSNFYDNFTETGLGLCCEEAARIILTEEEKFSIEIPENISENEKLFLKQRQEVFDILQKREIPIDERLNLLAEKYKIKIENSLSELCSFYLSLERLDESWTIELEDTKTHIFDGDIFYDERYSLFFEQLAVYFVFRHFEKGDKGVFFALLSCGIIAAICDRYREISKMLDIARMYSSEIEYSDENIEKIMNLKK